MKTRRLIAVPLLAGALALGACGGPGGDGEGGGPGDEQTSAPITAQDINAVDRAELAEGGELRQAITSLSDNWNPMHVNGNEADLSDVREAMSARLFHYNEKGEAEPNPNFLQEATTEGGESADEPLIVTYKLNPDAVWNDGSPIDVDDFIAEWKACGDPENDFQCVSTQGYDAVSSIEAGADNFEVKVTYNGPYPDWTGTFVLLNKAESIKDAETFNSGWSDLNEIKDWFSGPYILDNLDKTQQIITLVPNDNWWGEKPLLDKLTFRVISADATASSFENNEIDVFDVGPDPDAYARAKGVADAEIRAAAGPNFRHFTFNQEAGLIKDKAVRQAIVMGLNRAEIGTSDLAGIDWPAKPLNNHVFMETQEGYKDSAEATGLSYNPDGAKKLLEDEGWAMGDDGFYAKDGETLTVAFTQITAVPVSENEALQAQAMLKEVGIKVDIVDATQDNWSDKLTEGSFEILAFSWLGTPYPYSSIKQIYGTNQDSNYSNASLEEVDELIKQIDIEIDPQKRIDLANQADELLWEDVNTLPLYQRPDLIATKTNIANFGAFGLSSVHYENVGLTKE